MLQEWEAGLVGNNAGIVARMPRQPSVARVVVNLVRGRRARTADVQGLSSAA